MEKTPVQKLARVLKILVTIAFVCNLLVLPLVPGLVGINLGGGMEPVWELASNGDLLDPLRLVAVFFLICWQALWRIWREVSGGVLTVFLWLCGACTAIILWQARRVLNTILAGNPFQRSNAGNLRRAAVCCLVISAAARGELVREGYSEAYGARPLKRVIRRRIEDRLSEEILAGRIETGETVCIDFAGGNFVFRSEKT